MSTYFELYFPMNGLQENNRSYLLVFTAKRPIMRIV
jgi:hypothetical protein